MNSSNTHTLCGGVSNKCHAKFPETWCAQIVHQTSLFSRCHPEALLRACGDHSLVDHFAIVASRVRHRARRVPVELPAVALDEVRLALLHLLDDPPQVCQVDLLALERVRVWGALIRPGMTVTGAALLVFADLALSVLDVCQNY